MLRLTDGSTIAQGRITLLTVLSNTSRSET
jgi:hypothetical protein